MRSWPSAEWADNRRALSQSKLGGRTRYVISCGGRDHANGTLDDIQHSKTTQSDMKSVTDGDGEPLRTSPLV